MPLETLQLVWPILLVLFYVFTNLFITVLNGHFIKQTRLHDVVRAARIRRNEYLRSLKEREEELGIEDD